MSNIVDSEDVDDGVATEWGSGPVAFLVKTFIFSSLIAFIVWWFVLS